MTPKRRDILELTCLLAVGGGTVLALGFGTGLARGLGWGIIVVAGLLLVASVAGTLRSRDDAP